MVNGAKLASSPITLSKLCLSTFFVDVHPERLSKATAKKSTKNPVNGVTNT